MLEDWTIYSWYCPNCKTQVAGLKNKKNQIRVICTKCGVEMVRTVVSRRHDDYSGPLAHPGRSLAQLDRASAHSTRSAVQPMLAADQHTC